jgi:hypothetical protein
MRETREGAGMIFTWGIVLIVVLVVGTIAFAALNPILVKYRTDTNRSSQGYVEAKQSLLLQLVGDYNELESDIAALGNTDTDKEIEEGLRGQQKAIVARVREEANLLDPEDVPASVRNFIAEHPSR